MLPRNNMKVSRALKAVELKRSGLTHKQVGESLGVTAGRARQLFKFGELWLKHVGKDA